MKSSRYTFMVGLLGGMALLFASQSSRADSELEACQAGYRILLMTPGECKAYLHDLHAAQARGDYAAVMDLQEWHAELLIERSQSCPCRPNPVNAPQARATDARMPAQAASSARQP